MARHAIVVQGEGQEGLGRVRGSNALGSNGREDRVGSTGPDTGASELMDAIKLEPDIRHDGRVFPGIKETDAFSLGQCRGGKCKPWHGTNSLRAGIMLLDRPVLHLDEAKERAHFNASKRVAMRRN